jgi:hypothetical protein
VAATTLVRNILRWSSLLNLITYKNVFIALSTFNRAGALYILNGEEMINPDAVNVVPTPKRIL